jgi:ribosome maturation factor RimP
MQLSETVTRELTELVAEEGLELLDTEIQGSGPRMVLRLIVDGPGGVTLDQCAEISRQASAILDVEDPIRHSYVLEVSSPGLDRKLYRREDFANFAGRMVKVKMEPSYRTHRVVSGELLGLDGEQVRLRTSSGDEVSVPYDRVFEARLEVDWSAIMKEGKSRP